MTGFDNKGRSTRPWSARRDSRVARAWRIAMAHMGGGEIALEDLDVADEQFSVAQTAVKPPAKPKDKRPRTPSEDEIDRSADESFPASDPPSWSPSHA